VGERIEDIAERTRKLIEEYGYFIQGVIGDETQPAYYYTSGLSYARDIRYPELVMAGWFEPKQLTGFLRDAVNAMREGRMVPDRAGYYAGVFANYDAGVVPINPAGEPAFLRVPEGSKAYLVVIPDPSGLFPWEEGCHEGYANQIVGFDILEFPSARSGGKLH
jgi:hypothetical protein